MIPPPPAKRAETAKQGGPDSKATGHTSSAGSPKTEKIQKSTSPQLPPPGAPERYPLRLVAQTAVILLRSVSENPKPPTDPFTEAAREAHRLLDACWAVAEDRAQNLLDDAKNPKRTPFDEALKIIFGLTEKRPRKLFEQRFIDYKMASRIPNPGIEESGDEEAILRYVDAKRRRFSKIVTDYKDLGIPTRDIESLKIAFDEMRRSNTSWQRSKAGKKAVEAKKRKSKKDFDSP